MGDVLGSEWVCVNVFFKEFFSFGLVSVGGGCCFCCSAEVTHVEEATLFFRIFKI